MFRKLISSIVCLTFLFSNFQQAQAQEFNINKLPVPGVMVSVSAPFAPLALKGLVVNPLKPLEFKFIVDTGRGPQDTASVKDQANQLVKYFLAGLTIPEDELWVNLSPYEKDRMVPEALGQTDLGRDLLAQDYILKQLTASLIYPEKDLGKEFWSRVYAKAQQQFGTTNVPVNTFNKVWILPNQAQVFENGSAAYVTKSTLKVMLDEDYLAKQKHQSVEASSVSSQMVRQIIIPEIEKEVNAGKNFASLRQIYQALILAKWYKETIQNGLLDAVYTNKKKTAGVNLDDPAVKALIYDRYLQAYKKGVFNYIKEDATVEGQAVPRKYFSGGINKLEPKHVDTDGAMSAVTSDGTMDALTVDLEKWGDQAMVNSSNLQDHVYDAIVSNVSEDTLKFYDMSEVKAIADQVADRIKQHDSDLGEYTIEGKDSRDNPDLTETLSLKFRQEAGVVVVKVISFFEDSSQEINNYKPVNSQFTFSLPFSQKPGDGAMNTAPVTDFKLITSTNEGPIPLAPGLIKGSQEIITGSLDPDKPLTAIDPEFQRLADIANGSLTTLKILAADNDVLKDYFSSLLQFSKKYKDVKLKVSDKFEFGVDIATLFSTKDHVEIILSRKFADELLNRAQTDLKAAEVTLAIRLFHELGRPEIKSFYDLYKQEYLLIRKDFLLYKTLKNKNLISNFPTDQGRMLEALDRNPLIIGDFDKLIYAIELLEREAEHVFKESFLHHVGNAKIDLDTLARDTRIEEAYQIADPDFYGDSPSKRLNGDRSIKDTFLGRYAQILGQRGIVQGRESFLFLAKGQVTRIPFNQFKDPRVPEQSRLQLLESEKEPSRWGRQYYALHYGRRFADGIGVTEAENGRGMQQRWHVHETTQEYTTSLSDDTRLRYGHKLMGDELKKIEPQLTVDVKQLLSQGKEVRLKVINKSSKRSEERIVLQIIDENKNKILIIEDTDGVGIKVPFGSMIAMPKGTFHTLRNNSKERPSIDFTVKDAVTQIIKTFSPPNEIQFTQPQIIKPATNNQPWGNIYEHIYQGPYNSRLSVNQFGDMEYYFDDKGNPIPKMYGPIYMKLRIVEVKPGESTPLFDINPLYADEQLQAIRFFPWPREIPADKPNDPNGRWLLDRDHKQIKAEVKFYNGNHQEIPALSRNDIEGGDMLLINNEKDRTTGIVKQYRVTNTSKALSLVFFVVEPSDTIQKLLPYFNGDINQLNNQIEGWKNAYAEYKVSKSTSEILEEKLAFVTYADGSYIINEKTSERTLRPLELCKLEGTSFKQADFAMLGDNDMATGNKEKSRDTSDIAEFDQFLNRVFMSTYNTNVHPAPGIYAALKSAYARYNPQDRVGLRQMIMDEKSTIHVFIAWSDYANTRSSYKDDDAYDFERWPVSLLNNSIIPFSKLETFLKEFRNRHEEADKPDYSAQKDDKYGRVRARALAWNYLSNFDSFYVGFWNEAQKRGMSFEDASKVFDSFWDGNKLIRSMDDVNSALDRAQTVGGIDLNQISVHRTGKIINMEFDRARLRDLLQGGFNGFTPVIINMTPIQSPFPLLGINSVKESEALSKV